MQKVSSRIKVFNYFFRRTLSVLLAFSVFFSTFPQELFAQLSISKKQNSAGVKFYQKADGVWDYEFTGEGPWSGKNSIKNLAAREDIIKAGREADMGYAEEWARQKGLMTYEEFKVETGTENAAWYAGYIKENKALLEQIKQANAWMNGGIKTEDDLSAWGGEYLKEEAGRLRLIDAIKKEPDVKIKTEKQQELTELVRREILFVGEYRREFLKYLETAGEKAYRHSNIEALLELYGKMGLGEGERERGLEYLKKVARGMGGYCDNGLLSKDTLSFGKARDNRDAMCVEMSKALYGIGLLGGESDAQDIDNALEKYYLTRGGTSVLVNGLSGLLTLRAYGKIRGFILGQVERDILEKGYMDSGIDAAFFSPWAAAVGELISGRYNNKITELGNYSVGNKVYVEGLSDRNPELGNIWEDVGQMIAEDDSPEMKDLCEYILGQINVAEYKDGAKKVTAIGNKQLVTGILSAKSVKSGKIIQGCGSAEEVYLKSLYQTTWSDLSEASERRLKNKVFDLYDYYGGKKPDWLAAAKYDDKKQRSYERYGRVATAARLADLGIVTVGALSIAWGLGKSLISGIKVIRAAKQAGAIGDIWKIGKSAANIRALNAYRAQIWGVENFGAVRAGSAAFAADAGLGTNISASKLPSQKIIINPDDMSFAGGKARTPEIVNNAAARRIASRRPQVPAKGFGENIGSVKTEAGPWKNAGGKTAGDIEIEKALEQSGYRKEFGPGGKSYRYVRESWTAENAGEWTKIELRENFGAKELRLEKEYLAKNGLEIEKSGNGKYFRYKSAGGGQSKVMLDLRQNVTAWDKEGKIITYEVEGKIYKYDARYDGNINAGTLADDNIAALHRRVNNPRDPLRRQYKNVNGQLVLAGDKELGIVAETFGLKRPKAPALTEEADLRGMTEEPFGNASRVTLPVKSKRPQVIKAVNMLGDASVAATAFIAPANEAAITVAAQTPVAVVRTAEMPNAFNGVELIKPTATPGPGKLSDAFKIRFNDMGGKLIRNAAEGAGFELGRGNYAGLAAGSMLYNSFVYAPLKALSYFDAGKTSQAQALGQKINTVQQAQNVNPSISSQAIKIPLRPLNAERIAALSLVPVVPRGFTAGDVSPAENILPENSGGYMYIFGKKIYDNRTADSNPLNRFAEMVWRQIRNGSEDGAAKMSAFPPFDALRFAFLNNRNVSEKVLKETIKEILKSAFERFEHELFKGDREVTWEGDLLKDARFQNILIDNMGDVLQRAGLNASEKEFFQKAFYRGLSEYISGPDYKLYMEQKKGPYGFARRYSYDRNNSGPLNIIMDEDGVIFEGMYVNYPEFFKDVENNTFPAFSLNDRRALRTILNEAAYNAARVISENAEKGDWKANPITPVLYAELKKSFENNPYLSAAAKEKFNYELGKRISNEGISQDDLFRSMYSSETLAVVDNAEKIPDVKLRPEARLLARVLLTKAWGMSQTLEGVYRRADVFISQNAYLNAEEKRGLLKGLDEEIFRIRKVIADTKDNAANRLLYGGLPLPQIIWQGVQALKNILSPYDFLVLEKFGGHNVWKVMDAKTGALYAAKVAFDGSRDEVETLKALDEFDKEYTPRYIEFAHSKYVETDNAALGKKIIESQFRNPYANFSVQNLLATGSAYLTEYINISGRPLKDMVRYGFAQSSLNKKITRDEWQDIVDLIKALHARGLRHYDLEHNMFFERLPSGRLKVT
ncbi:MAG: hypothetical protein LBI01_06810, partial [Elusimicrobium sp.]|nr:hypothetical protein [Elusimicrobium sp.]